MCVFFISGTCIPLALVLFVVFSAIVILFLIGYGLIQGINEKKYSGGYLGDTVNQGEDDKYDHPYSVGTRVLVGTSGRGLEAYLVVKKYDEDESCAYCELQVEVPAGSTNPFVDHVYNDDSLLGMMSVHYQIGERAVKERISLYEEILEYSSYTVIISAAETSDADLTSN